MERLEPRLLLSGTAPEFATALTDQWFTSDGALTIGVDGYDVDGDALTITVDSDNPGLTWFMPTGNRFAVLHFVESDAVTPVGDIVLELFETRGSAAAERFITLATNYVDPDTGELDPNGTPFYTDVVVHRVIPNFMIQTGDAENGDGTGGSPLGTFDDAFDPDLSFANAGVLAMANSGLDTNDCQFFITDAPARWLNQIHMIFGHVISGYEVLDTIINLPTSGGDRPDDPPLLDSVEIVESTQDATVTFNTTGGWAGAAQVTVTLDDGNGNQTSQTITVTALGDRPTIAEAPLQSAAPGESISFLTDIDDDGGLPMDLSVSATGSAVVSIDQTGQVDLTAPAGWTGVVRVTVTAVEEGYEGLTATAGEFYVAVQYEGDPPMIGLVGTDPEGVGMDALLVGDRLYVACGAKGLEIFDVSDPAGPVLLGRFADADVIDSAREVEVVGDVAFVANTYGGLLALDVSDPGNITVLDEAPASYVALGVAVAGGVAFVPDYSMGLIAFDISDPSNITKISTIKQLTSNFSIGQAVSVVINGPYAYVADATQGGGFVVLNVSDPARMKFVTAVGTGGSPWGLDLQGNRLYIADQYVGLLIADVSRPGSPKIIGGVQVTGAPWQVKAIGNTAVVANNDGFVLVEASEPAFASVEYTIAMPNWGGAPGGEGNLAVLPIGDGGAIVMDLTSLINRAVVYKKATFADDSGVPVTIIVKNAVAKAHTTAAGAGDIELLEIIPYAPGATVKVITTGGRTTVGEILVTGSIKSLDAKTTDIAPGGGVTFEGSVATLRLGNVADDHLITIGPRDAGDVKTTVSLTFERVAEASLVSQTPIKTLTVTEWLDEDGTPDLIQAPWIGKLTAKGDRRTGIAGDFQAGLDLDGTGAVKLTLGSAKIAGDLGGAAWDVSGEMGAVTVKGTATDSALSVTGGLKSLTVAEWLDEDGTPDLIEAGWIGRLTAKGDRRTGVAGDFQAGLDLSGAGATKATLGNAKIAGDLDGASWNVVGDMGKLTVNGAARDSTVRTTGLMAGVTLGAAYGSDFLAGMSEETYRHASEAWQFEDPLALIKSVKIKGWRVPAGQTAPRFFQDSNFSAARIGPVSLVNADTDNAGETFGIFALDAGLGTEIRSVKHKDTVDVLDNWQWSLRDGKSIVKGDLVAGVIGLGFQLQAPPEVRVELNGALVSSGQSQPIDLGTLGLGTAAAEYTFSIQNFGSEVLTLGAVSLTDSTGFEVAQQPAASLAPGASTTFKLRMLTDTVGQTSALVQFDTNDPDEDPFRFQVAGEVEVQEPEVSVYMVSQGIADGQATAASFGQANAGSAAVQRTFTIYNIGNAPLTVGAVVLENNTDFEVVQQPAATVAASGSTTFVLRMLTDTVGTKSADVRFDNDDADENPFNFSVTGQVKDVPSVTYAVADLGAGLYGYTFTVNGNDAKQASFFAKMTFEGVNGGVIQQQLAFGSVSVNSDSVAASYDLISEAGYDMDRDSYFLEPFPSNTAGGGIAQSANSYSIEAGTGTATGYESVDLVYIVCTGDVHFYGTISRQGQNYPIDQVAVFA